ncbi:hypothetical protein JCM19240_6061 [Vibrio maritimus]|uniref:Uncharacterized protein n=1 Tax=Vibrio maritimus TaxID=990268 RepID=A0A090T1N9_9VIBR|nr:hypothetical protein JCM19240_6061 [Vibrio maritimus]
MAFAMHGVGKWSSNATQLMSLLPDSVADSGLNFQKLL